MKKMLKPGLSIYLTIALAFSGCSLIDDDNDVTITTERKMLLSLFCKKDVNGIIYQEKTEYKYDANGNRIKKETTHIDNNNDSSVFTYEYKYDFNRKLLEEVQIKNGEQIKKTENTYDQQGNLIKVIENDKLKEEYDYKYNGKNVIFSTIQYTDQGIRKTVGTEVYTDSDLKYMVSSKSEVEDANGNKSIEESNYSYKYDGNGNIIETTEKCNIDGIPAWVSQITINGSDSTYSYTQYDKNGVEIQYNYDYTQYTDTYRNKISYHKYEESGENWEPNISEEFYRYNDDGNVVEITYYKNGIFLYCKSTNYVYNNNIETFTIYWYDKNENIEQTNYYTLTYEQ